MRMNPNTERQTELPQKATKARNFVDPKQRTPTGTNLRSPLSRSCTKLSSTHLTLLRRPSSPLLQRQ